jgi:hypothetical protein
MAAAATATRLMYIIRLADLYWFYEGAGL